MDAFTKELAGKYVFSTHIQDIGTWSSPESILCGLVAGLLNFGRVAIKDQQLLDSPGFYELIRPGNGWGKLYQALLTAEYEGLPRVLLLVQDPGRPATAEDAIMSRLHGWIKGDEPFLAWKPRTPSKLITDAKYQAVLGAGDQKEIVERYAEELHRVKADERLKILLEGMSHNWMEVLPEVRSYTWEDFPSVGARFYALEQDVDWSHVNSHSPTPLDLGKIRGFADEAREQTRTTRLYEVIGCDLTKGPLPRTRNESNYLWDLATWSYVTNVADRYAMSTVHTTLGCFLSSTIPRERRLRTFLAGQFTHMATVPAKLPSSAFRMAMVDAAVDVICESDSSEKLPAFCPNLSEPTSDEAIERLGRFTEQLYETMARERAITHGMSLQKRWDQLRSMLDAVPKPLRRILLGCALFTDSDSVQTAIKIAVGGEALDEVMEFLKCERAELGLLYGEARTLLDSPQMRRTIGRCFPDVWRMIKTK